jgi:hypothetical protein
MRVTAAKKTSLAVARALWPESAPIYFGRVKDNGRAEAALIGLHGLRQAALLKRRIA